MNKEISIIEALKLGIKAQKLGNLYEADRYYTAVLKVEPKHPDANHNMGVLAITIGEPERSLSFFKNAVETNPKFVRFWISYISVLIKLDRNSEARVLLETAKESCESDTEFEKLEKLLNSVKVNSDTQTTDRKNPPQVQQQALINLHRGGKHKETIKEAENLLKAFPESVMLLNIVGASKIALENVKEAIEVLNLAISIDPDHAESFNNIGIAHQQHGNIEEAIRAFKTAIRIAPNYVNPYYNIGYAYHHQNKLQEAIGAYKATLKIAPDHSLAYYNLGNVLKSQGMLDEAIEAYHKTIGLNKNFTDAFNNMGIAFRDKGELARAIEAFEKAINLTPGYAALYNNIGIAYQQQGKLEKAIKSYKKAINLEPNFASAFNNMGITLRDQCKFKEAINAYKKAIKLDSTYAEPWVNGAECFEKTNKLVDLSKWLSKALLAFEKTPSDILFMKAKLLQREGKIKEASKIIFSIDFETITPPRKQDFLNLKGSCFEKQHKFDSAFKCYQKMNLIAKNSLEYTYSDPDRYFKKVQNLLFTVQNKNFRPKVELGKYKSDFNPIFLVGFPRSGTTLLDTILRSHSKLIVVEEQPCLKVAGDLIEASGINILSNEVLPPVEIKKARLAYQREFSEHSGKFQADTIYIDKLPLNLLHVPLVKTLFPEARFILALRHPIDTIFSCWVQNFKLNGAMANMVELERIVDFYCISMEIFKTCRDKYNLSVHEIRYEDLLDDLKGETSKLLGFLNLHWEVEIENYRKTAIQRELINTPSYSQVVQPIYKTSKFRWKNYKNYLDRYTDQVSHWTSAFKYKSTET